MIIGTELTTFGMDIKMSDLVKKDLIMMYTNEDRRLFHVVESKSMICHIDYMFSTEINFPQFKRLKNDILDNKVKFQILETCSDKFIRRTKLLKYRDDMLAKGYKEYTGRTNFINAKVTLQFVTVGRKIYAMVYIVVLVTAKT